MALNSDIKTVLGHVASFYVLGYSDTVFLKYPLTPKKLNFCWTLQSS